MTNQKLPMRGRPWTPRTVKSQTTDQAMPWKTAEAGRRRRRGGDSEEPVDIDGDEGLELPGEHRPAQQRRGGRRGTPA